MDKYFNVKKIRELNDTVNIKLTKRKSNEEKLEEWESYHGNKVVAPKGTFDKLYHDLSESEDDDI